MCLRDALVLCHDGARKNVIEELEEAEAFLKKAVKAKVKFHFSMVS